MATQVVLGDTTRIQVSFRDWDSDTDTGGLIDPALVEGFIRDENLVELDTFVPNNTAVGVYRYDWTPASLGSYYIEFKGTFADTTVDTVRDLFQVVNVIDAGPATYSLEIDQFLTFATTLSPMYLDVWEMLSVYPDADAVEVAEYIHFYSIEAEELLGADFATTPMVLDFIKASTLCALSRLYAIGDFGQESMQLGDLIIKYKVSGRGDLSRGSAVSWCELAAVLREEMMIMLGDAKPLSYVRGLAYPKPIPPRALKDFER